MRNIFKALGIIALSFVTYNSSAQSFISLYNAGQQALKDGELQSFKSYMVRADSLRPNHPVIMYKLAQAYTLNNEHEHAFDTLEKLLHFYASPAILDSTDFSRLVISKTWVQLKEKVRSLQEAIKASELVFEFEMPGFHPEGIAYDNESGDFYLTDIREGMVYRFKKEEKKLEPFLNLKALGFWSAMGVKVDPVHPEILWVTTSAIPQFSGYKQEDTGESAVLKFNKRSGKLLFTYKTDGNHVFGDLTITKKGKIYITDSQNPVVFTIENNNVLKVAFQHTKWWNLQGLALSDNEKFLYVSDYITGIYKIEIESGKIEPLIMQNEWLRGGDGVYQKGGELFVLQNGTTPKRVGVIKLDRNGSGIFETLRFPDQAREDISEPTLGTWLNGDLYFIGNSPWGYYNDNGEPKLDEWPKLKVFRLTKTGQN